MLGIEKALAGVAIAFAVATSVQTWRLGSEQKEHLRTNAAWSAERANHNRVALNAQRDYDDKAEQDRQRAQKANDDAKQRIEGLAQLAATAGTERDRLQRAYSAAIARSCAAAGPAAPAGASQAASAPANLPTDVLGRIDEAADRVAGFAEQAMSAAETCASAW